MIRNNIYIFARERQNIGMPKTTLAAVYLQQISKCKYVEPWFAILVAIVSWYKQSKIGLSFAFIYPRA